MKMSTEEQGTVRRRILIALGLAAATAAFSQVPSEWLDGRGNKPAAAYLVPVLRSIVRLPKPLPPPVPATMTLCFNVLGHVLVCIAMTAQEWLKMDSSFSCAGLA